MKKRNLIVSAIGIVAVGTGVGFYITKPKMAGKTVMPNTDIKIVQEAAKAPKSFVAKNEKSKDVKVQTQVTRARMTLAYEAAKKKDFKVAREGFVLASKNHKGTEAMSPEFGTLSDQAAYQAIVCLEASGDKDGAKKEYRKFMMERKLSPLVHMCFRRLERLNGKNEPNDEAQLQVAIAAQEAKGMFEMSVCGPKCLEKVLPMLGKPAKGYEELAKLAGTNDKGTTMDGLQEACKSLGLKSFGLDLNAKDFRALNKPAIWLQNDHYVSVLKIEGGRALLYDPRYKTEQWHPLPSADDNTFRATLLAFEVPTTDLVTDIKTPSQKS